MKKRQELNQRLKNVLFRAWALRNQFNGEHDNYYFPRLSKALDKAFPEDRFPEDMLPGAVKAVRTKTLKRNWRLG